MKNLAVILIAILISFFLTPSLVKAIEWEIANEKTVSWDAVTTMVDGSPVPDGDTILYRLFLVSDNSTDRIADKTTAGETDLLTYTLVLENEGRWIVGIRAIRTPQASPEDKQFSEIVWSDDENTENVPNPFGLIYFAIPEKIGGFKPE